MSPASSLVKIRLLVGGVVAGVRWGGAKYRVWNVFTVPRSTSSYPRKSG